jgi:peroxiredoxin
MDPQRTHLPPPPSRSSKLPWKGLAFVAVLLGIGLGYLGWTAFRPGPGESPGRDLAGEVREYLRQRNVRPLSEPLRQLLAHSDGFAVPTQAHPLLGKQAPDFALEDPSGKPHALRTFLGRGPVVLVFYYGYYCNHCVGQLFALDKDLSLFHELGAEVVALSPDAPADTRQRFRRYGAFQFPVLSDPQNEVARRYVVFQDGNLSHATFVIDRDGFVRWVQFGVEPFTNDRALLLELARLASAREK